MLRRCLPLLMLAPLTLALTGCETTTDPSNPSSASNAPQTDRARAGATPFMATSEYVEMVSTLRDLYDRALARGYSQADIVRAASAGDAELDTRMLGLTAEKAARLTGRLEGLRGSLEVKYPELAESTDPSRGLDRSAGSGGSDTSAGIAGFSGIETIAGTDMNATAAAGCRWLPATSYLFSCARNGGLTTYIACAMVTWANYCDDIEFTDFLEGVGPASDALGGGGGGAH
ncbi:MAG: hypothetical protein ACR2GQ_07990 [Gemmatimonadota bacterium]